MASLCRYFQISEMYTQESIDKLLFSSTRRILDVLEVVRIVRYTLEEIDRLLYTTGKTLKAHHRSLIRVCQVLKGLQRLHEAGRKQDLPGFMVEFLAETRDSVENIGKLLSNIRHTKHFLNRLLEHSFGPLGGKVVLEPCNTRVKYTP